MADPCGGVREDGRGRWDTRRVPSLITDAVWEYEDDEHRADVVPLTPGEVTDTEPRTGAPSRCPVPSGHTRVTGRRAARAVRARARAWGGRLLARRISRKGIDLASLTFIPAPAKMPLQRTGTDPVPRLEQVRADATWLRVHAYPWATRRLRGRSSGDLRVPKRPRPAPVR